MMFNDSIKNSFPLSLNWWFTHTKPVETGVVIEVYIGSAQIINNPKLLIVAHQTAARKGLPNKENNIAVFDNVGVRKYFVGNDGIKDPKDSVSFNYEEGD